MTTVTVLTDTGAHELEADLVDGAARVPAAALDDLLGWHLQPQGLCRGDVCMPLRGGDAPDAAGQVDLVAVAALVGRPAVVDAEARVVAIGVEADERVRALRSLELPAFSLPDLDGAVHHSTDWRGRKTLLLAFSSW
jgi:hypothetical protein